MLHVTDRQSLNFQFGAFTVLVFHTVVFLALIHSCRGQSQVIGPSQPIVALVGEDIILPCDLDPVMNAFDMTVEWARPDLVPRFVLVWRDSVELESKKNPSYTGRTSLFTEELKHGNISLKLSKVKKSDEGTYRCFTPELNRLLLVQLVVGAVSSPVVQMTTNLSGVFLQCESKGWYPQPEVLWLDGEGKLLSAGPTETLIGPDDLHTVSSRVTVEKRLSNNFTCRVQQQDINQTREAHVYVPDYFFMEPSPPGSQSAIISSVVCCVALVFTLTVVYAVWTWRQKKSKNKRRSAEDGPEQAEEEKTLTCTSDNTGVHVVLGGEREALMAGGEENKVDIRGKVKIQSQSQHIDETHQNPLVTNPDMDRAEGGLDNERVPQIPTEGETQHKEDMTRRLETNDGPEDEGEQMRMPINEDSGLRKVVEAEGQNEQQPHVHAEPEVQKAEETHQGTKTDVDKEEANVTEINEHGRAETGGSGLAGQKKQPEADAATVVNKRTLQSEMKNRKQREEDETELKLQKGHGDHHVLEDKIQEGREQDQKEKDKDEQQSNITNMNTNPDMDRAEGDLDNERVPLIPTEGETQHKEDMTRRLETNDGAEDEGEQMRMPVNEDSGLRKVVEAEGQNEQQPHVHAEPEVQKAEETHQGTKTDVDKEEANDTEISEHGRAETGGSGLTGQKKQPEAEPAEEEEVEKETELKSQEGDGNQKRDSNGQEVKPEDKKGKDKKGNQRDITRTTETNAERQKETTEEKLEEKKLSPSVRMEVTEKPNLNIHQEKAEAQDQDLHKEDTSLRNQEESKEQSNKRGKVESKERQKEGLETDKGADIDNIQNNSKGIGQEGPQQEEIREQVKESTKGRGVQCQDRLQEQPMEVDSKPQRVIKKAVNKKHIQKKMPHVDRQQSDKKRKCEVKDCVQTEKHFKIPKMEEELEQDDMNCNSQQDQTAPCQEEPEDQMEVQ